MALRYWVGGTAAWDATAGTKWALTSGGAGGQAVPSSADDVFFDAASGAVTCTITGSRAAKSVTTTGFTGTVTGAGGLGISGNLTLDSANTSFSVTTLNIIVSSVITCNGEPIVGNVTLGLAGATFSLGSDLIVNGDLTLTIGTLTITSPYNVYLTGSMSCVGTNTRAINFGAGTWYLQPAASGKAWTFSGTGLTFTKQTAVIEFAHTAAVGYTFAGNGLTYNGVRFSSAVAGWTVSFTGANTFTNWDLSSVVLKGGSIVLPLSVTTTISSLTRGNKRASAMQIGGATTSTTNKATLACASGNVDLGNAWIQNLNCSGSAKFFAGHACNIRNNAGVIFIAPNNRASMNTGI